MNQVTFKINGVPSEVSITANFFSRFYKAYSPCEVPELIFKDGILDIVCNVDEDVENLDIVNGVTKRLGLYLLSSIDDYFGFPYQIGLTFLGFDMILNVKERFRYNLPYNHIFNGDKKEDFDESEYTLAQYTENPIKIKYWKMKYKSINLLKLKASKSNLEYRLKMINKQIEGL